MNKNDFQEQVNNLKRVSQKGTDYWSARALQALLGYNTWNDFDNVIRRAMDACSAMGQSIDKNFWEYRKVIGTRGIPRKDFYVTRLACYLIAMNGDPRKTEIAFAQAYFTVKTRLREIDEQAELELKRVGKRVQIRDHNKALNTEAKKAGVKIFGKFHNAGYKGLYDSNLKDVKSKKGLTKNQDLLDFADFEELAANDFRITQTTRQLDMRDVETEQDACSVHFEIGRDVRDTIQKIGNPMPEDLPIATDIKKIERKHKKLLNKENGK